MDGEKETLEENGKISKNFIETIIEKDIKIGRASCRERV